MLWKSQAEVLLLHSIGCDDYLGSDKVVDKCGVCGGDNTGCQVVSGVFKHALTSLGYHRVVEIPQGATKINITEMYKSNNYLGKRSCKLIFSNSNSCKHGLISWQNSIRKAIFKNHLMNSNIHFYSLISYLIGI
ncbi:hypothetical protein FD755_013766 [Muntiacus reevesi]|uniref:Uncharacterized protein n=1 Tax=Muntiacus reevesi TaxID=9886 RepID=A0A5N3XME2_MUNRE|nr:hypothetical protein FD755_013766 [Muntiacus reevesi]